MLMQLIRDNFGVQVWLSIFVVAALVMTAVGLLMSRSGVSLRSLWWFGGLLLIVGLPQLAGHVYLGMRGSEAEAPRRATLQAIDARALDAPENLQRMFGADVDPALVRDAKTMLGAVLAQAEVARFAAFASGESVLLARFADTGAADRAWVAYLAAAGLTRMTQGNSERGFSTSLPGGDRVYVLPMNTLLGVWTGPDDAAIRARMAAGGFAPPANAPLAGGAGEAARSASGTGLPFPWPVQVAGLVALVFIYVLYFFKGASWAGAIPAAPVVPLPAAELRARLAAVNTLDVPFQVEPGANTDELAAVWRYADANWIDHARMHGMKRIHRVVMRLDEAAHAVRVSDHEASHDWSAGADGVHIQWRRTIGITFFQYEHQRVFGLQLDANGRFRPQLSYAYTFSLQEMKAPLIAAVTQAGWDWKPVLWDGPKWLRWVTE